MYKRNHANQTAAIAAAALVAFAMLLCVTVASDAADTKQAGAKKLNAEIFDVRATGLGDFEDNSVHFAKRGRRLFSSDEGQFVGPPISVSRRAQEVVEDIAQPHTKADLSKTKSNKQHDGWKIIASSRAQATAVDWNDLASRISLLTTRKKPENDQIVWQQFEPQANLLPMSSSQSIDELLVPLLASRILRDAAAGRSSSTADLLPRIARAYYM